MATIKFSLHLDRIGQRGNAARLWLDTSRDASPDGADDKRGDVYDDSVFGLVDTSF